jgi:hypothetical protein
MMKDEFSDLAIDLILQSDERHHGFEEPTEKEISSLRSFLARPWFHRVWVIQEVAWSWTANVLCGSRLFPWSTFKPFLTDPWTRATIYSLRRDYADQRHPFVLTLLDKSPITESYSTAMLFGLLCKTRNCLSTDPRDKVFALLPLFLTDSSDCPLADYSLSTIALFTALAETFIKCIGLETLLAASGNSKLDRLPSWVPDWASRPLSQGLLEIAFQHPFPETSTARPRFCASSALDNNLQNLVVVTSNNFGLSASLEIDGICVDEIHTLGDVIIAANIPRRNFNTEAFTTWPEIAVNFASCFPSGATDPLITYYKVASLMSEKEASDWEMDSTKVKVWLARPAFSSRPPKHPIRSIRSLHDRIVAATHGRRFFITRSGYMGLSPPKTHIGDIVYLIKGLPVPVILRKSEGSLRLVGEAYVQGIMLGELLQQFHAAGADGASSAELLSWQSLTLT